MIFVLEGPDGAGKSTLARRLSETYGMEIWKKGPPSGDFMSEYVLPLMQIQRTHKDVVLDRWHVGELTYGPLLRGKSMMTYGQAAYVELVLRTLGATFIHVTASYETLLERINQRGDDLIKPEHLSHLMVDYETYTAGRNHWFVLDTDTPYRVTDVYHLHGVPIDVHPRYLGSAMPEVLLLGDQRNEKSRWAPLIHWPFGPAPASSGLWLFDSLVSQGVDTQCLGLINACELEPRELRNVWSNLYLPPVVALGNNAARAAEDAKLTFIKVPHPQYARRFQHYSSAEYVQRLLSPTRDLKIGDHA